MNIKIVQIKDIEGIAKLEPFYYKKSEHLKKPLY